MAAAFAASFLDVKRVAGLPSLTLAAAPGTPCHRRTGSTVTGGLNPLALRMILKVLFAVNCRDYRLLCKRLTGPA
jgi:hypothetical protein